MTPHRYLASLRTNPLDESVRIERGADDDTLDAVLAGLQAKRLPGEVVVLIDFVAGGRFVVDADGGRVAA